MGKRVRFAALVFAGAALVSGCSSDSPKANQCQTSRGVKACVETKGEAYEVTMTNLAPDSEVDARLTSNGTRPFSSPPAKADPNGRYPGESKAQSFAYPSKKDVVVTLRGTAKTGAAVRFTFTMP